LDGVDGHENATGDEVGLMAHVEPRLRGRKAAHVGPSVGGDEAGDGQEAAADADVGEEVPGADAREAFLQRPPSAAWGTAPISPGFDQMHEA
jgi:hypothetical protein